MYDIVVVGAGTAGLSAAIYGVRAGKSVLVLEGASYGGQIINTPEIENYPAIKKTSGFEFATELFNQAKELGAEVKYEKVVGISLEGNIKKVATEKEVYEAKSVILATGAKNRPLGLPNEKKLVGSGISYCATCDGMFYRGKVVAVNGGGNTAIEDATFLANVASKVYVIHRRDEFRAEEAVVAALKKKDNVEFVLNSNIVEIKEESFAVSAVVVEDKNTNEIFKTLAINDNDDKSEVFEKEIERKLQDIIIITRSIPTDKEFYQKNINRIQPFFTREAGDQLKESLRANQVTEKLNNRESVTVDIDSVIKLERNKRKYQVIWTEKYMKMTGDIAIKKYVAVIDVILVDVKSNEMKKNNPLGVMIKDINISESNISKTE